MQYILLKPNLWIVEFVTYNYTSIVENENQEKEVKQKYRGIFGIQSQETP